MAKWPSAGNVYPVTPKAYPGASAVEYPGTVSAYPSGSMSPAAFSAAVLAAITATEKCLLIGDLGVTDAGGGVASAWNDQSGNGNHFVQVTGGAQPAIAAQSAINNRVALTGDGANDVMASAAFNFAANYWVYCVFSAVTFATADGLFGASSAGNRMSLKQDTTTPGVLQQGNLGNNTGNAPIGQWHRLIAHFGTTTADFLQIGQDVSSATVNCGTTAGTGRVLFANTLASNFGNYRMAMFLVCSTKPSAGEVTALDALVATYYGGNVFLYTFKQLYATYWWDTDTSTVGGVPPNDYLTHEPFANVSFTTSDTSVVVSYVATSTDYSTFGVYVDGAFYAGYLCTGDSVAHQVTVSLPGGAHTVTLVEGPSDAGRTYLQSVTGNVTLTTKTTPAHRLMGYGDSISMGLQGTGAVVANMTRDAWPVGLRAYAPGRVTSYGSGGRTFKSDADAGLIAAFIAKTVAILDGSSSNTVVSGIGTNDWGTSTGAVWSAASFKSAMDAWVAGILASRPAALIYLMTPIIREDEADTNTFGDALEAYRQAIRDAVTTAALPAQVILIEASAWLTLGDLVDGTHPNAAGHATILANLKTALGY